MTKKGGFPVGVTLVELMIVIALIGILAALATPTIRRTQERASARQVGSQIANDLRTARNQAMSRGEALWVSVASGNGTDANRGTIQILRSELRCDDGSAPSTGAPETACPNSTEARRARSCRQEKVLDAANPVLETDFARFSGTAQLAGTSPATGLICFNPDGRVLDGEGNVISGGGAPCAGENFIIYTARSTADATDITSAIACGATTDERDLVDVFRVTVPFNGAIKMDQ
jgi:prepilin-type N-terminal cleavage/methylation domain-containing protein